MRTQVIDKKKNSSTNGMSAGGFMNAIIQKNPLEKEFIQAVGEVAKDIIPFMEDHSVYKELKVFERMCEPERIIMFRVPWIDDKGEYHINRGFRVEMNSSMGPTKGGLRFHSKVGLGTLKFLAFEQVFKNGLTTLRWGGGKSGSEFDPKGKSDNEIMRFCQGFMNELFRHLGPTTDIPLGDIGVGVREIGFLFGQYKRLGFSGIPSQEGAGWGGSLVQPEATGYSCSYFCNEMLATKSETLKNKICIISGSGNVAQYAAEKALHLGAKVVTLSDSNGFIYDKDGIDEEKLEFIKVLKNVKRGRIKAYADHFKQAKYFVGKNPWGIKGDVIMPCATQNELDEVAAKEIINNRSLVICEGADMPCTPGANAIFKNAGILLAPSKASTAAAVAVSGLEILEISEKLNQRSKNGIESNLKETVLGIHEKCIKYGKSKDNINYVKGANIAGFVKIADAMLEQGLV